MNRSHSLAILAVLMALVAGLSVLVGPVSDPSWALIVQIRIPRVLLAVVVGGGLAGAGAILQGVLRNPLADPFILGTSSAAAAGVVLASLFGLQNYSSLYSMSLGFALLSIFVVYRIARVNGRAPVQTIILAGVIVNLFFNAVVFLFFSIFYRESYSVLFFLLGSLTEADWNLIGVSGGIIAAGLLVTQFLSSELNILTQGESTASHLGVDVSRSKRILFVTASAMVAASVAVAGMIGFVGLIVPHMIRMVVGPDHRILVPASALAGAIFLILADVVARSAFPPLEIPVGALTALIGSPYFIYLLRRRQTQGEF